MSTRLLDPYVPRILLRHLVETPEQTAHTLDATVVFVDISGFTRLSERLARAGGREGAEKLSEAIGATFEHLLRVAYLNGGSLLKFGGDALMLLFEDDDHVERACGTALAMRHELRLAGPIDGGGTPVRLRMSCGVHCGAFHFFVVGGSHRELLIAGPAVSEVGRMEKGADAGQIVVSAAIAARLPAECTGASKGAGVLLLSAPDLPPTVQPPLWTPSEAAVAGVLSPELRAHVLAGVQPSEHRTVTVAFLRFEGTDALVADRGVDQAAPVLEELVALVGAAADERQVCFLGSDIDVDAGKIILTAGAPRVTGDEEERMMLVLRRIVEDGLPLPVRIGVHRGALFAGDIGPHYRRTYTVMGDVVNLAARLMAKCPPGEIYATAAVLERSRSRFATTTLEPFMVKGKAKPVHAFAVGPVLGRGDTTERAIPARLPLMGRDRELEMFDEALASAARGEGRLVELVSEPGMGRSRLMDEVRDRDDDFRVLRVACEAYTMSVPYGAWRGLLRELGGVDRETTDAVILDRLSELLEKDDPGLLPWLPLLAIAMDVEAPPTPEVTQLAPEFRSRKLREVVLRFVRRRLLGWALIEWADAQFMDEASAELLHELELQLPILPWLVVVGRRDTEAGFVAAEGPHLVRVELAPLTPEQALALAEAVTEDTPLPPHLVSIAVERSGGSPQFLRDLLRATAAGSAELPDSIEAAAMARIDRMHPADRDLVRRASVLGMSFHPRDLEPLLDPSAAPPTQETWDRLDAYFAAEGHGYLRFRREIVREVAYAGLAFRVRRAMHAAVGERLEAELGDNADSEAARLGAHFLLAGQTDKAWRYARVAADRAEGRHAFADATILHRNALEAGSRFGAPADDLVEVWEKLGRCLTRTGELGAADEAFRAARRLVVADPVQEARLLLRHAQVAERAGRLVPAVRWANRGLRVLDGLAPGAEGECRACRAQTLSVLATIRQRQGRIAKAIAICEQAIREAETAGDEGAVAHACFILDWALFDAGRPQEATHSRRALEIYERLEEFDRQAAVLNNMGGFAYHEGRWDDAVQLYRRAAEVSERAGDIANAAFGDCNVGEVLSDQGRWEEAEQRIRRALRIWRGSGYEWGTAFARALLGRTAVRAGRHEEGLALLEESLASFRRLGAGSDAALVRAYVAEAHVFRGESASALEATDRLLGHGSRTAPLLHRVRGFALAQRGETDLAAKAFEASLEEARAQDADYEAALTLDALQRLPTAAPEEVQQERREQRDALLAHFDVVVLPDPPAQSAPAAAAAGAA